MSYAIPCDDDNEGHGDRDACNDHCGDRPGIDATPLVDVLKHIQLVDLRRRSVKYIFQNKLIMILI